MSSVLPVRAARPLGRLALLSILLLPAAGALAGEVKWAPAGATTPNSDIRYRPQRHDTAPAPFAPTGHDRAYYRAEPLPIIPPTHTVVTREALTAPAAAPLPPDPPPTPRRRRAAAATEAPQGEGALPKPPAEMGGSHLFPGRRFAVPARVFRTLTRDMCALTFDDGPSGSADPSILATLSAANIKATWFVVGKMAQRNPSLLRQISEQGHELAVHGWTHHDFRTMDDATRASELADTVAAIKAAAPNASLALFRPPYGGFNTATIAAVEAAGLKMVMWNVDSEDWRSRDSVSISDMIGAETQPGGVILMHSTVAESAVALPGVIQSLSQRGCRFYTVSEWLAEADRRIEQFNAPAVAAAPPPASPATGLPALSLPPPAQPAAVQPAALTLPVPATAPVAPVGPAPALPAAPAADAIPASTPYSYGSAG